MSEEEIRIAVAKLCGWKVQCAAKFYSENGPHGKYSINDAHFIKFDVLISPTGKNTAGWAKGEKEPWGWVPNYTQSLDACATFEAGEGFDYWDMLYDVCNRAGALGCIDGIKRTDECWMRTNKATPLQRCESKLRLNRKWVAL